MSKIYFTIADNKLEISRNQLSPEIQTSIIPEITENLPILFENYLKILKTPEYYFINVPGTMISTAFIGRKRSQLYLGELLSLWYQGKWTTKCSVCEGTVYINSIGGSPLSGRGSATGICSLCKKLITGIKPFSKYLGQVMTNPNPVLKGNIVPVDIETLLIELI